MRLEIGNITIEDVQFGDKIEVKNKTLFVNKDQLLEELSGVEHIKSIDVDLARPGEEVRITPVKDVIEPRVKMEGDAKIFPGVLDKVRQVGEGRTNVLKGAAVVTCGKIVGFQEGIIDMTGPGAEYTPFSKLNNVCLIIEPEEDITSYAYEEAARVAGLKAASYIAECCKDAEVSDVETYETKPLLEQLDEHKDLPKVGYVYMLQTQGLLHDTYLYGTDVKHIVPTILYPTEVMDGAIISGNCVSACDKNTTYHHLNNPVIKDLYSRHGKDINFVGVIVTNETVYLSDKDRSSDFTSKLAEYLGLDGVVVTQEGFGNPDTDLIMNCRKISEKGIKTVIVTDEYAGRDGASQSLADAHESADAVVTGGNANEVINLPAMKKVIGMLDYVDNIAGGFDGSLREDGSIEAEIQVITGATNELGFNKMTATTN